MNGPPQALGNRLTWSLRRSHPFTPLHCQAPAVYSRTAGIVLMLVVVRLMWSLTAQRRLSVITRTITQVAASAWQSGTPLALS